MNLVNKCLSSPAPVHTRINQLTINKLCISYYSPEAKHSFERIMEILYGAKNGVHALGYNFAENEQILVKSGALRAHFWKLALADFGHDSSSSDSLRGSRNFVFVLVTYICTILPISRRTNFTTFEHNNGDR